MNNPNIKTIYSNLNVPVKESYHNNELHMIKLYLKDKAYEGAYIETKIGTRIILTGNCENGQDIAYLPFEIMTEFGFEIDVVGDTFSLQIVKQESTGITRLIMCNTLRTKCSTFIVHLNDEEKENEE